MLSEAEKKSETLVLKVTLPTREAIEADLKKRYPGTQFNIISVPTKESIIARLKENLLGVNVEVVEPLKATVPVEEIPEGEATEGTSE